MNTTLARLTAIVGMRTASGICSLRKVPPVDQGLLPTCCVYHRLVGGNMLPCAGIPKEQPDDAPER
jgi:hypothetical protein